MDNSNHWKIGDIELICQIFILIHITVVDGELYFLIGFQMIQHGMTGLTPICTEYHNGIRLMDMVQLVIGDFNNRVYNGHDKIFLSVYQIPMRICN